MSQFTEEQLKELETVFGLKREESLPVRDGRVTRDSMVWWRGAKGPEQVRADSGTHWHNISAYPDVYQLAQPVYRVEYFD